MNLDSADNPPERANEDRGETTEPGWNDAPMDDIPSPATKTVPTSSQKKNKTIILIRHAQSEENVKVIELVDGLDRIRRFKCPTCRNITSTLSLLTLTLDSAVSQLGARQIKDMHMILRDARFWNRYKVDAVVCSPLARAKETCEGVLPPANEREGLNLHAKILDDLEEANIYEHVFAATLLERIERFKRWLHDSDEETIVVVGHCQYFKKMLGQKTLMRNCDVWQVTLECGWDGEGNDKRTYKWGEANVLYRTDLADTHPLDKLLRNEEKTGSGKGGGEGHAEEKKAKSKVAISDMNDGDGDGQDQDQDQVGQDQDQEQDPACRICQMTQSEAPSMKLIRPCKCTGSLSLVHVVCLNRWRETSRSAYYKCPVCKYDYRIRKTWLADLLMSDVGAAVVTVWLLCAVAVLTGVVLLNAVRYTQWDLPGMLFELIEVHTWWRHCRVSHSLSRLLENIRAQHREGYYSYDADASSGSAGSGSLFAPVSAILEEAKVVFQALRPPYIYYVLLCNETANAVVDVLLLGCGAVGLVGFAHYVYGEFRLAERDGAWRQNAGGGGGPEMNPGIRRLAMLGMWLASLGNRALFRLGMFGGCCIAARELYQHALVKGRSIAQSIGEQILEYSG